MGSRTTQILVIVAAVAGGFIAIGLAVVLLGGDATASRTDYQATVVNTRDRVDFAYARIARSSSIDELIERMDEASAVIGKTASDLDEAGVAEGFEDMNARLVTKLQAFSNVLHGTAEQFQDPTFGGSLGGINSLSFPEWDEVNKILAEMKAKGIQVDQLERH
jgi:hypothetical protein